METYLDEHTFVKLLPSQFENAIIGFQGNSLRNFFVAIRTTAASSEQCHEWVRAFEKESRIDWNVWHTFPNVKRYQFKKHWLCSHSDHRKTNLNREDMKAKAKGCRAKLKIVVKLDTAWTKKTDEYVKKGLI